MRSRTIAIAALLIVCAVALVWIGSARARAAEPANRQAQSGRYVVATQVMQGSGTISTTLISITGKQTHQLYLYRAEGDTNLTMTMDPELYAKIDLSSAGQKSLQRIR